MTRNGAWRLLALAVVAVLTVLIYANGWPLLVAVAWAFVAGSLIMTSPQWKRGMQRDKEAVLR